MKFIPLVLVALALTIPANARRRHVRHERKSHATSRSASGAKWDPGHTLTNPYGMPRLRRKPSK
jgi:hypothetical protein